MPFALLDFHLPVSARSNQRLRGRKIKYTTCPLLVQDLLASKRDLRLGQEIKKLAKYDGLIIDEMGYVQQSREEMEVVFTPWHCKDINSVQQSGSLGQN